jgi:MscS family membrane protein
MSIAVHSAWPLPTVELDVGISPRHAVRTRSIESRVRSPFSAIAVPLLPCLLALAVSAAVATAQTIPGAAARGQAPTESPRPKDALGRDTPRGTVLGFLNAARKGENELARQYLDTRLGDKAAAALAHQLAVVLDARLPARLTQISDAPEGSRSNPLTPDRELVGTIEKAGGRVDVYVDRVTRAKSAPIWLFSNRTLDSVPALYEEIAGDAGIRHLLTNARGGGIRLLEWLTVLLGIPALYFAFVLVDRLFIRLTRHDVLPAPARLLLLAIVGRWLVSSLPFSLLVRQFWSSVASVIAIAVAVWLLILFNGAIERYVRARLPHRGIAAGALLLRLLRRGVDLAVIVAGLFATLRFFAVDATPALAGLGVGGIAVALAAQKTLENVIAGVSLILDEAIAVGDFLKMGNTLGTVDHIGLRSTRLRTLDRTIVTVPNGQIANATLETFSARDKYWFHPVVSVRYETSTGQLRAIVDGIQRLLDEHPAVDRGSVRVRFIRLGTFSLDVDVFAYLFARDWNHFLEIQERLLFAVTEIVERAGTAIALPSQTMYMTK